MRKRPARARPAALIVHDTEPAAYGWNVVQSSWTGPQYNMDEPGNHMDQSKVIGWLTSDAARRLLGVVGPGSRRPLRRGEAAGLQGGAAAHPRLGLADQPDQAAGLAQRDRHPAGREAAGRICHLHRPLGPSRPLRRRPDRRRHLQRRARQRDRHRRPDRARRSPCPAPALPSARSSSSPSPPRNRACSARKYYAENPIYPLAQTVGGINMDGLNIIGNTRDFVVDRPGQVGARGLSEARRPPRYGLTVKNEPTPRGRLLLPLRPFQPRQARRADALCRRRRGSGQWRRRRRPRGGRGLPRQPLPPAERRI